MEREPWKRSEVGRRESLEKVCSSLEERWWVWSESTPPKLVKEGERRDTSCCTNLIQKGANSL